MRGFEINAGHYFLSFVMLLYPYKNEYVLISWKLSVSRRDKKSIAVLQYASFK